MPSTAKVFCPLILISRNAKAQDFGTALVKSICNRGQWEVVFNGKGTILFQCALWDERHGYCSIKHISRLALHEEKKQTMIK